MESHKVVATIFHIMGIVVILGFMVLQGVSCAFLFGAMGDNPTGAPTTGVNTHVFGDKDAEVRFLRVPVMGVISYAAPENLMGLTEMSIPERMEKLLAHAEKTESIDGILLDIDSPGGAVDPSDVMFHKLMEFKARTGKPIVARMNSLAASGGYYIAVASDRIIAHPSTLTGSIGVIMQSMNMAGLFDKIGLDLVTLASGPNKDLLNPGREMTEEEREILMGVINETHDQFVNAVVLGRDMDEADVRRLADGRIYTSRQALEGGLIDAIGYEEDLLDILREISGAETVEVVRHKLPSKIWDLFDMGLESAARHFRPESQLKALERLDRAPGLYYLWEPGI
jgi:protease IV